MRRRRRSSYRGLLSLITRQTRAGLKLFRRSVKAKPLFFRPSASRVAKPRAVAKPSERGSLTGAGWTWARPGSVFLATSARRPRARLSYGLFVPNLTKRLSPKPLVVMLHGCEQDARAFAEGTRMPALAERYGFAVLFPEQPKTAHSHRCWHWYEKQAQRGGGEAAELADMIDGVSATHGLDRSRIYVAGLSAGAAMAAIVALRFPGLIAAVGLHSGVTFGTASTAMGGAVVMRRGAKGSAERALAKAIDLGAFPGMPAIIIHGAADDVVRAANRDQLVRQFVFLNGLAGRNAGRHDVKLESSTQVASPRRYGYRLNDLLVDDKLMVRECIVDSLGHAWSGGVSRLAFNDGRGPNASKLMWEFFKNHARGPVA